jgi:hypothetical protein
LLAALAYSLFLLAALPPPFQHAQGLEVGVSLLGDFGPVVCKFGPDALKPVLKQTIAALTKQTPQQLARLPALADALATVDPKILAVSGWDTQDFVCRRRPGNESQGRFDTWRKSLPLNPCFISAVEGSVRQPRRW